MISVLESYEPQTNFWEAHPQFKKLGLFADFYKDDTSRKKSKSSTIMWGIAFLVDNSKYNRFRNFPEEERKKLIEEEIIKYAGFEWKNYEAYVSFFEEMELSPLKRNLRILRKKMDERMKFIEETSYDVSNAKELDSIITNTDKLFDLMIKLEKQIEKEENESSGSVKGGRTESLVEQKII